MAEQTGQEKTEQPTGKRLEDARQKGQVPRSRELTTVLVLIASAIALFIMGSSLIEDMAAVMNESLVLSRKELFDPVAMVHHFIHMIEIISFDLGLFLSVTVIAALAAPALIGGWNFSTQAMAFKPEKMDPIKGLKRVFGPQGLVELGKALGKFILIGAISTAILWGIRDQLLTLGTQEVNVAMTDLAYLTLWIFLAITASLILIALIDVPFQLWNHSRQLRMTKQEVKDEMKQTDGNPEVKGRIRRMQIQMSQQRMMQDIPSADVVITNPTHYAVAMRYDQSRSGAPIVVAKGADLISQQIRLVAENNDVPILAAPPLTRAVYYSTEIGEEIPSGLYIAVAQVLAFVFQLRRYRKQGGNKPHLNPEDLPIPDEYRRD
ncbi:MULTISPECIES: flagellar biosynthesis protein FlhB [unclassified Methylophaga]|jgi:flagellar biosynthetic protein FlhB|uniref:flagellar biosynthesis protein FlhB n=1 Tax=unclassified Methylophaga TaxID=2629249 RepID=UPI00259C96AE|nr:MULTISPECIES: flagellar biosynthesis protein FlhB [unclassified Methylophaga]|tara:strand:+ start:9966 stop:11099 length:1134 start_codon:yes stop_codon:yes gene_type:complete